MYIPSSISHTQCVEVRMPMISVHQGEIIDYNKVRHKEDYNKDMPEESVPDRQ
jgi:hypothetical protein